MATKTKKQYLNPFAMFANVEVKTAKIKALGGAEIKYRELTLRENDEFNERMVKDFDPTNGGNPTVDIAEAQKIKYERVALMLDVMGDATITAESLRDLPGSASDAIDEILDLQKDSEESVVDEKGN